MVYSPQDWTDEPSTDSPMSAARFDYMEAGIKDAAEGKYTINAQTGTTYTLVLADAGKLVTCTNAAAISVTVPQNVFAAGQRIDLIAMGAGSVTIVAGAGTTVSGTPSLVSRAQYSGLSVICVSSNTFVAVGDLAA